MSEKLEQLQNKSLQELKDLQVQAKSRKAELDTLKAKGGSAWNSNLQDELDELVLFMVDLEEFIDTKEASTTETTTESAYVPDKGTEKLVHLMIVHGRRFNSRTGKEESKPYKQLFTYGEFVLFAKNAIQLGYSVVKVLHDPYGEANKLVVTE